MDRPASRKLTFSYHTKQQKQSIFPLQNIILFRSILPVDLAGLFLNWISEQSQTIFTIQHTIPIFRHNHKPRYLHRQRVSKSKCTQRRLHTQRSVDITQPNTNPSSLASRIIKSQTYDEIWQLLNYNTTLLMNLVPSSEPVNESSEFHPTDVKNALNAFEAALQIFSASIHVNLLARHVHSVEIDRRSSDASIIGEFAAKKLHCERLVMLARVVEAHNGRIGIKGRLAVLRALLELDEWWLLFEYSTGLRARWMEQQHGSREDRERVLVGLPCMDDILPFLVISLVRTKKLNEAIDLLKRQLKFIHKSEEDSHIESWNPSNLAPVDQRDKSYITRNPSPFTLGVVIEGCVEMKDVSLAKMMFELMLECGITPSSRTIGVMSILLRIDTLSTLNDKENMNEELGVNNGNKDSDYLANSLKSHNMDIVVDVPFLLGIVRGLTLMKRPIEAKKALERMREIDRAQGLKDSSKIQLTNAYTMVMNCITQTNQDSMSIESLLMEMKNDGLDPSLPAYTTLMHCHYKLNRPRHVKRDLTAMIDADFTPDQRVYNILICSHIYAGKMDQARNIFDSMINRRLAPSLHTLTSIMAGYVHHGDWDSAQEFYELIVRPPMSHTPDLVVYNITIDQCARKRDLPGAIQWYKALISAGHKPDAITYTILMWLFTHILGLDTGRQWYTRTLVQDPGFKPSPATFTLMMNEQVASGDFGRAVGVFKEMQALGITPDVYAYTAVLAAYVGQHHTQEALVLFSEMVAGGTPPSLKAIHMVMGMLLRVKRPDVVVELFERLTVHDKGYFSDELYYIGVERVVEESTTLTSLGEADALSPLSLESMIGPEPDVIVFSTVINAVLRLGNVPRAVALLWTVLRMGMTPQAIDYQRVMIRLLQRGTHHDLKHALRLVEAMNTSGVIPSRVLVEALLERLAEEGWMEWCVRVLGYSLSFRVVPDDYVLKKVSDIFIQLGIKNPSIDVPFAWSVGLALRYGLDDSGSLAKYFELLAEAGESHRVAGLWMLLVGVQKSKENNKVSHNRTSVELNSKNEKPEPLDVINRIDEVLPIEKNVDYTNGEVLSHIMRGKIPGHLLLRVLRDCGMRGGVTHMNIVRNLWKAFINGEMIDFGRNVQHNDTAAVALTEQCVWNHIQMMAWWEEWGDVETVATDELATLGIAEDGVLRNTLMLLRRRGMEDISFRINEYWRLRKLKRT
ncbi:hypothetical protein HK096_006714 [Nowakowskiella sp. JEL0078]|nr:hypothetical protein HK096_006714 [Nowakowskiella sp. JEL0078]